MSLGKKIDDLHEARAKRLEAEKEIDALKAEEARISEEIMEELNKAGLKKASGSKATASISSSVVPQVTDWEALTPFILRNKALHLFERRLSAGAFRELLEQRKGKPLPGVEAFTKQRINLTKLS